MREIRFRGKRVDNGEWVVGFLELHLVDGDLTKTKQYAFITYDYMDKIGKVYRDRFEVIPETVGQFTGLLDKNGKKIYEGDILKVPTSNFSSYNCVIEYIANHARFLARRGELIGLIETYGEVIGNIYEHPDLLEVAR